MSTVTLPRLHWGPADSPRRALLVHGLGSSAHTMWRVAEGLAERGWSATAVDLRGHGEAPRASRYRIEDIAGDLVATRPIDGAWDLVLGHSIAGAATVQAAATASDWTARLVLLDPTLVLDEVSREQVRLSQLAAHDNGTIAAVTAEQPHWHPHDVELRVRAVQRASRHALERMVLDNHEWDVRAFLPRVTAPTLVIAGEAERGARFTVADADEARAANPGIRTTVIGGTGHNVHRDDPAATLDVLLGWLDETAEAQRRQ